MRYVNDITQEYLKIILEYNPETGKFKWLVKTSNRIKIGMEAGTLRSNGYLKTNINGQLYYNHRLAFLYMTGRWPTHNIDHINGSKDDNSWINLREATHSQNNKNRASYGKALDKNIYLTKGKYAVRICLGTYHTKEEAILIRDKFLKEFKFEDEFLHSSLKANL